MALKNLTLASCANKAEAFCRIRDFLCKRDGTYDYSTDGIGWTLFDASYAANEDSPGSGDWFVAYSAGETGDDDLYVKFEWISGIFRTSGYLAWNPTTHAGTTSFMYSSNANSFSFAEASVNFPLYVDGDLDFVLLQYRYSTNTYTFAGMFGLMDPMPGCPGTRDTATCSSALSAGTGVNITVDSVPADWGIGTPVIIRTTHTDNISTAKIEITAITNIAGNEVTCNLTNSYTANSKLSSFLAYVASSGTSAFALSTLITSAGTVNQALSTINGGVTATYLDPTGYRGQYAIQDITWIPTTGWPIMQTAKIKHLGSIVLPMVIGDYIVDKDSNYYRICSIFSAMYVAVMEA